MAPNSGRVSALPSGIASAAFNRPAPGRAPRRPRKPPDGELLLRLRRLEGVIHSLGVQVDETGSTSADYLHRNDAPQDATSARAERRFSFTNDQNYGQGGDAGNSLATDLGRLVISEGRSRYVNSRFWAALSTEVEDLKGVLDESSEDEADVPSPATDPPSISSQHGFLFNSNPSGADLHSLHPPPDRVRKYWQFFVENCDPLMKMLHVPTMQQQIYSAAANPGKASRAIEVLLFAVYYATVTSLSAQECQDIAGESQETLAKRYRYGLEQALVRAHFLVTEEIVVLQAFILFLVCVRRFEDPRVLWSLCGVACRIAITLGLHHDGTTLGIPPFDIEIRRRTWWQILVLDIRSSEDHGSDPVIIQHSFDTRFPLNVEDEDLSPTMTASPTERVGITKMSFTLTRYYTAMTFARLFARPASFLSPTGSWPEATFQEKQRWVQHCQHRLEERFFRHYNMDIPLHWITYTVAKLILAKQWLMLYQPFLRAKLGADLPMATRDHLFLTSLEAVESSIRLEQQRVNVKWGWLFKTYTQFHALTFILTELTRRTSGPMVDRAWQAVEDTKTFLWEKDVESRRGPLTKPLLKLEAAARAARDRAQSEDQNQNEGSDDEDDPIKSEEEDEADERGICVDFPMIDTLPQPNEAIYGFEHGGGSDMGTASYHTQSLQSSSFTPHQALTAQSYGDFYRGGTTSSSARTGAPQFPVVASQMQRQWSQAMPSTIAVAPGQVASGMIDWFAEPTYGALSSNIGSVDSGYNVPGLQPQHHQHQQPHHAHLQQQQQQQQQGQQGLQVDPMVGGTEAGMQFGQWDEIWDDLMVSGSSGVPGAPQWQRRPLTGEPWQ